MFPVDGPCQPDRRRQAQGFGKFAKSSTHGRARTNCRSRRGLPSDGRQREDYSQEGHPSVLEALHNGTITINGALEVCKFERTQQVEELARFLANKSNSKTNRVYIDKLHVEQLSADLSVFFAKLQHFEATNPGSVEV